MLNYSIWTKIDWWSTVWASSNNLKISQFNIGRGMFGIRLQWEFRKVLEIILNANLSIKNYCKKHSAIPFFIFYV